MGALIDSEYDYRLTLHFMNASSTLAPIQLLFVCILNNLII